ncbi:MAG: aa3-type cytochrome c oxidase subunit IV [Thalassobaculaceae bacterium]|nr:aa3-type cytochrome c oxidase subunit IV [Thalassobaculaceae bacterium]
MAGNDQFADMTRERKAFWEGFMSFTLWTGIALTILVVLMAIFIV